MGARKPFISVIIITFNESKNITECLSRVRNQRYPQHKIEIILVDDYSTDGTLEMAKPYHVKVVKSGFRHCERAKSLGIQYAQGELILFLDADVFLVHNEFISKTVELFLQYSYIVAAQSIRWQYNKNDYIINRYCNLFGINDPLVLFLGKRGTLGATEKKWFNRDVASHKGSYYEIVKFGTENLPTLGSNGYMVRRNAILKTTWTPFFFHLDSTYELVEKHMDQFALTTLGVRHDYVHSFVEYHKKAYRNISLFLNYRTLRKYNYNINPLRLIVPLLLMFSVVYPLIQSVLGYRKKPDAAWFLHPILCITVPVVYSYGIIENILRKNFNR